MMRNLINIIIVLTIAVWGNGCGKNTDIQKLRKIAIDKYRNYLQELEIHEKLFTEPIIDLERDDKIIFQWSPRIHKGHGLYINVYLPYNNPWEGSASGVGDNKYWRLFYGTAINLTGEAVINELFNKIETNKSKDILDGISLSTTEQLNIVDFIEIKMAVINFIAQNGRKPEYIDELPLRPSAKRDESGNFYGFLIIKNFLILGAKGADNSWNIDMMKGEELLKDESEKILKVDDDLIAVLKPVNL